MKERATNLGGWPSLLALAIPSRPEGRPVAAAAAAAGGGTRQKPPAPGAFGLADPEHGPALVFVFVGGGTAATARGEMGVGP